MSDDPAFVAEPPQSARRGSAPATLPVFRQTALPAAGPSSDLELTISIELGRVRMRLEDVLRVSDGSVLELDKHAGDLVDVVVNDQIVARGEVVVLNDKFAVRICDVTPAKETNL